MVLVVADPLGGQCRVAPAGERDGRCLRRQGGLDASPPLGRLGAAGGGGLLHLCVERGLQKRERLVPPEHENTGLRKLNAAGESASHPHIPSCARSPAAFAWSRERSGNVRSSAR